jgi:hypothetical protein
MAAASSPVTAAGTTLDLDALWEEVDEAERAAVEFRRRSLPHVRARERC